MKLNVLLIQLNLVWSRCDWCVSVCVCVQWGGVGLFSVPCCQVFLHFFTTYTFLPLTCTPVSSQSALFPSPTVTQSHVIAQCCHGDPWCSPTLRLSAAPAAFSVNEDGVDLWLVMQAGCRRHHFPWEDEPIFTTKHIYGLTSNSGLPGKHITVSSSLFPSVSCFSPLFRQNWNDKTFQVRGLSLVQCVFLSSSVVILFEVGVRGFFYRQATDPWLQSVIQISSWNKDVSGHRSVLSEIGNKHKLRTDYGIVKMKP